MAFRKRNIAVSRTPTDSSVHAASRNSNTKQALPGVKPSPIDGRPITSTGTPSLDSLLAGHGGLATGNSLLIEENGTTDYAGALIRYYAAEGVVQGHSIHVLGLPEGWGRELPGVAGEGECWKADMNKERMKIAWRYEGLGEFGVAARRGPAVDRMLLQESGSETSEPNTFCHIFDLTKRLSHPGLSKICYIPLSSDPNSSPFDNLLKHITKALSASSPDTIHRLVVPSLLSPALYPSHASHPSNMLRFVHVLRSLLRQHSSRLTVLLTLPLSLYPRSDGLVRMLEHTVDGVLELTPFPHPKDASHSVASASQEEKPQGLLVCHKLPVFHERGGGGPGAAKDGLGEDLAFTVSKKNFEIRPFSLPPAEGDTEAQGAGEIGKRKAKTMEF